MALVPYRVSGPAASDSSEERLLQFDDGRIKVRLQQHPRRSGAAHYHLQRTAAAAAAATEATPAQAAAAVTAGAIQPSGTGPDLSNVGLVVWQSAYVLADFLLRHPPFGAWAGVRMLELGAGTGACGIALALAGACVVLTDLPHITLLTRSNVEANCGDGGAAPMPMVVDHVWGEDAGCLLTAAQTAEGAVPSTVTAVGGSAGSLAADAGECSQPYDVVIGADVLYEPAHHQALLSSLAQVCAQHTQAFLAYRLRGLGEERFELAATAAGWALEAVPCQQLHTEFQDGEYRIIRLVKLDVA